MNCDESTALTAVIVRAYFCAADTLGYMKHLTEKDQQGAMGNRDFSSASSLHFLLL